MIQKLAAKLPENNRLERIWVMAKANFLKRYYGSFLGLFWALINPVVHLMIYFFVFTIVFKSRQPNFALFLFLGLLIYFFFAEASSKSLHIFSAKRYLLENIPLNKLDIYYASILSAFMGFVFNLAAFFIMSFFFPIKTSIDAIVFPLLILNLFIFILGIQLILSIIHVYLKDFAHVWNLTQMALLWLSGVFYQIDPSATWKSAILAYLTPLAGIISNARKILIYGEGVDWFIFLYDFGYAILLLGLAMVVFNKYSPKALEKL
jgi:lipopolysaccharide transport system permease protein